MSDALVDGVYVHPSAFVDLPATIGAGSKIWHFSHLMAGATLGAGCSIGQNVFIAGTARLGANVKVQNNVSIYDGVVCEDDVFLGPSCVFTNVKTPRSHVNRRSEYTETRLGRGVSVGANATIVCGINVGRYAFIGAGAVVTRDVPDYALMVGVPARQRGWACWCGVPLVPTTEATNDGASDDCSDGDDAWGCEQCGRNYCLEKSGLVQVEGGNDD